MENPWKYANPISQTVSVKTCFCSKENLTFTLYCAPFGNLPNGTATQIFNSQLFETVEIPLKFVFERYQITYLFLRKRCVHI